MWVLMLMVMIMAAPAVARADHNRTPIAVPLLGTQGAAGPYGSSIQINARGGASHVGQVVVRLLGVTHPCPEDLAVLLVHGADKHLLMSNAGGCRPLQGTNLFFHSAGPAIPNTQPVTPVYGAVQESGPSNYGDQPEFPAPAPAGPYTPGMPGASTNVAHNSFGVTQSGLRWGVADGRIGGARDYQTYILLANPNPRPAEIEVRFLKPGFTVTRTYTLTPFSRRNIWANSDVPELGPGVFSADVRVLNYQPIAVEKALYWSVSGEVFAGGTNVTATRMPPP